MESNTFVSHGKNLRGCRVRTRLFRVLSISAYVPLGRGELVYDIPGRRVLDSEFVSAISRSNVRSASCCISHGLGPFCLAEAPVNSSLETGYITVPAETTTSTGLQQCAPSLQHWHFTKIKHEKTKPPQMSRSRKQSVYVNYYGTTWYVKLIHTT